MGDWISAILLVGVCHMLCPFCIKFNTCPDPEGVRDKGSRSTPTGSPQSYRVPQQYWPRGYKTFSCSTEHGISTAKHGISTANKN